MPLSSVLSFVQFKSVWQSIFSLLSSFIFNFLLFLFFSIEQYTGHANEQHNIHDDNIKNVKTKSRNKYETKKYVIHVCFPHRYDWVNKWIYIIYIMFTCIELTACEPCMCYTNRKATENVHYEEPKQKWERRKMKVTQKSNINGKKSWVNLKVKLK